MPVETEKMTKPMDGKSENIRVTRVVDNKIRLICLYCTKSTRIDMNKHPHLSNKRIINYKCKCGYVGKTKLEKRACYRKPVSLSGELIKDDKPFAFASILDLSKSGLKFECHSRKDFKVGENLELEFRLNDKNGSMIRQKGAIRHQNDFQYGLEFIKGEYKQCDRRLEFYFF